MTSQLVSSTFCLRRRTSYQATHENATGKFKRRNFCFLVLLGSVGGQNRIFQLPSCGNLNLQRRITSTSLIYIFTAQIMNDSHSWDVGFQQKPGPILFGATSKFNNTQILKKICHQCLQLYSILTSIHHTCLRNIFLAKNPYSFPGKYHDSVLDWIFQAFMIVYQSVYSNVWNASWCGDRHSHINHIITSAPEIQLSAQKRSHQHMESLDST